jgi:4-hydroxybenzoate polyprenyltransferase
MTETIPHPTGRWSIYLRLGRVSNVPTVWTNCLAGLLLAGGTVGLGTAAAVMGALSAFYIGGMFLNDAFDAAFDRKFRPERPIPSGHIGSGEVYAVGFGLLAAGEVLLCVSGWIDGAGVQPLALVAGAVLAALIVYYNYRHKNDPLSPLIMALCRAMIYVTVAALVLPMANLGAASVLGWGIAALVCYLIGLTYVAKQENLSEVRNLWPLLFLAEPFLYRITAFGESVAGAVLYVALLAWVGYCLAFLIVPGRKSIPKAVTGLIAGISLLDGLLIAGVGASWGAMAATVVGFGLTLLAQRWVPGT